MNVDISDYSSEDYIVAHELVFPEDDEEGSSLEAHPWLLNLMEQEAKKITEQMENLDEEQIRDLIADRLLTALVVGIVMGVSPQP